MTGAPRFDRYDWRGGREAMLRFGPDTGPVAIAALPLFEEANRTRAFLVSILRALADRGIGGVLPDPPGQGESVVPLETVSLADLRMAFRAATDAAAVNGRHVYAIALRSGAIIDDDASVSGRWHLAPQNGPALVRELARIQRADPAGRSDLSGRWHEGDASVEIAGNLIAAALLRDLETGAPRTADRTVRLASDAATADCKVEGPALWRRTEPDNDMALVQTLGADIADWVARCEG